MVKRDPAWKYAVEVEGPKKNIVYCKCNFCNLVVRSGISRLKNHLAGTHKEVKPCPNVPKDVKDEISTQLKKGTRDREESQNREAQKVVLGSHYERLHVGGGSSHGSVSERGIRGPINHYDVDLGNQEVDATRSGPFIPPSVSDLAKAVRQDIARFFYENGIPFHTASSPSFINMLRSIGNFGRDFKAPSAYEISGPLLVEEKKCTDAYVADLKKTWLQTGVSIIFDGWEDIRGRQLINILVNNLYGTVFLKTIDASEAIKAEDMLFKLLDDVVEEVGEELVVQVITDNASNYVAAGKLLMSKRQHLYWTPCASHCIELMFEKIKELPHHKIALRKAKKVTNYIYNNGDILAMMRSQCPKELVRPATTRFGTAYLTLQSMVDMKQPLQAMFTSIQWSQSTYSKQAEGKKVRKIILDDDIFWQSVGYVIKTTKPLFTVLRMIDSEKIPGMGFLYGLMVRAKKEIKESLDNNLDAYAEIIKIIDAKSENQMHQLHAVACFLNPHFHYDNTWVADVTMKIGIFYVMDKLIPSLDERCEADVQLDSFKAKRGIFGSDLARLNAKRCAPVDWWDAYGNDYPELRAFAIKVLSLTCSFSTCEWNWSTFNQIPTKKRNRLSAEKMNSLVYVMYNMKLKARHLRKISLKDDEEPLALDTCLLDDEWIGGLNEWIEGLNGEEASRVGIDSQKATQGEGATQGESQGEGATQVTPWKTYSRKRMTTLRPSSEREKGMRMLRAKDEES